MGFNFDRCCPSLRCGHWAGRFLAFNGLLQDVFAQSRELLAGVLAQATELAGHLAAWMFTVAV